MSPLSSCSFLLPLVTLCILEEGHRVPPGGKERGFVFRLLGAQHLHKSFGILHRGLSPFINWCRHLYQAGLTRVYFLLWVIIQNFLLWLTPSRPWPPGALSGAPASL